MGFEPKTGESWNWSQAYESSLLERPTGSGDTKCCSFLHAPFQAGIGQSSRVLTHRKNPIPNRESRSACERKPATGRPTFCVSLSLPAVLRIPSMLSRIPWGFSAPVCASTPCSERNVETTGLGAPHFSQASLGRVNVSNHRSPRRLLFTAAPRDMKHAGSRLTASPSGCQPLMFADQPASVCGLPHAFFLLS